MLTEAAPGVWVGTSSVMATTSTVVVAADGRALLVDPGVTADERDALAREVADRGWRVAAGLSSHAHWDHLLWAPALGAVPRWALPGAVDEAATRRADLLAELAATLGPDDPATGFADVAPLAEGPVPGFADVVVLGHDAHAAGHAATLVRGARTLLVGDMLSDLEIPLLDLTHPQPVTAYADGLALLRLLLETGDVDVVVPGHGSVADRAEAFRRLASDEAYLAALVTGRPVDDPRLAAAADWLLAGHRAQVQALGAREAS